jgi:hypothetical protein
MLIDPYLGEPKLCICERYNVSETRERGGFCTFEMSFVELGSPGNTPTQVSSQAQVQNGAETAADSAAETANAQAAMLEADPMATP